MNSLIKNLTPETLARLTAAISNVIEPGMNEDDFAILSKIINETFDAGEEKAGFAFHEMYFDAVAMSG